MYEGNGGGQPNVVPFDIADYEAMFLCGYALAEISETDTLGFVACQPQSSCVRMLNAFAIGARYAKPEATVKVLWANSWYDPAKEKEATNTLISEGINSIGFYGGTTAVASACNERSGVYTNGVYINMDDLAPNAMICSVLYAWDPIYETLVDMLTSGTWSTEAIYPGFAEGGCALTELNENVITGETLEACKQVRDQLMNKEIEVFAAPVYDNVGNCVLEEGKQFTPDDYITMLYLEKNVIGSLSK